MPVVALMLQFLFDGRLIEFACPAEIKRQNRDTLVPPRPPVHWTTNVSTLINMYSIRETPCPPDIKLYYFLNRVK